MILARTLAPGPSPRSAQSLYPTVLRVPTADYQAFLREVVTRYEQTVKTFWPKAMLRAARAPHPRPVSDQRIAEMLWHSVAATMLTREIDEEAAQAFAPIFDAEGARSWLVCDLTSLRNVRGKMLPGLHSAPSRVLLEEAGELPVVRAIDLDGVLLRPTDGAAWELGKLFVRQGLSHTCIMARHPRNHFPYDTVNGVTRRTLPADHVVRQLLEPHFYIHLALNFGVLYSDRSVARNNQKEIYAPFATTEAGQFGMLRAGWKGIRGSVVWKPYRYPLGPVPVIGPYGDFCRHYVDVIRQHVARVLAGVDPTEPHILRWADEIAMHLPGFPSAIRILEPGMLQAAVTSVIAGVSVLHTAEHYTYSGLPVEDIPLRLRIPAPTSARHPGFRYEDVTTRRDVFRHHMAREMFFKVFPVRRLKDVEYRFHSAQHQRAADLFNGELAQASRKLPGREYVPLDMLAASLQY